MRQRNGHLIKVIKEFAVPSVFQILSQALKLPAHPTIPPCSTKREMHTLVAKRKRPNAWPAHRRHSLARLYAMELLERNFGRALYAVRGEIERQFAWLTNHGAVLMPLGNWVRRLDQVRLWVQAKWLVGTSESFNLDKREVFQEIFQKTPYIELLSMLAYNLLGVLSATSEADNIIKRPPSSLYFQDFSEIPAYNPLGIPSATSEADNIIKRPLVPYIFRIFQWFPFMVRMFSNCKRKSRGFAITYCKIRSSFGCIGGSIPSVPKGRMERFSSGFAGIRGFIYSLRVCFHVPFGSSHSSRGSQSGLRGCPENPFFGRNETPAPERPMTYPSNPGKNRQNR